jgi:tripartite ATP-independent transporter DctM subunit
MVIIFLILFLILVLASVPIAFSLGLSSMIVLAITKYPIGLISQRLWTGLDKFNFIAIPFFILAGELMCSSGILDRLLDFSRLIIGRVKGGLLYVNVLASMLFGGINGSAVADTSAIGGMLIPATIKEYKDPEMAAAVTACSSVVGPIIPPSLPMLIYALAAGNVSIGALFLAGIIPGVILGLGQMIIIYFMIAKKDYPKDIKKYQFKDIINIVGRFSIAAVLPLIMVGGIVFGVFSPTEASCIATIYALFIGFFITRELTFKKTYHAVVKSAVVTSIVFMMISMANIATWWLSIQQLPKNVAIFIQNLTSDPDVFLFLVVVLYLIIGLFIEAAAAMIMLAPVLVPLSIIYGIDPVRFGLITCLGLLIGLVTPPVGLCLFIASDIANTSIEKVFKAAIPIIFLEILVLFIVVYFPQLYLWIPAIFGY